MGRQSPTVVRTYGVSPSLGIVADAAAVMVTAENLVGVRGCFVRVGACTCVQCVCCMRVRACVQCARAMCVRMRVCGAYAMHVLQPKADASCDA
jgi:hypothetical protein